MEKISLYIADIKVDLDDNSFILFNYTMEDLSNPTIVRNPFTKTIKLKGTDINNKIFGHYYQLDKVVDAEEGKFNPLVKVPFKIYDDLNNLLESGYMKLNNIVREGEEVIYDITLYGELGRLLYELSYNENGEERSLADLDYDVNFLFALNKDNVYAAWQRLQEDLKETTSLWDVVNFVPITTGVPEKFNANKAYLQDDNDSLVELPRNHTEWETRDLRCQFQRPAISIRGFFQALERWMRTQGYSLQLDSAFFTEGNPHYIDAWCTLPMFSDLTEEQEEGDKKIGSTSDIEDTESNSIIEGVPDALRVNVSGGEIKSVNGHMDFSPYDESCYINGSVVFGFKEEIDGYLSYYDESQRKWRGTIIGMQAQVRRDYEVIYRSPIFLWGATAYEGYDERVNNVLSAFGEGENVWAGNLLLNSATIDFERLNVLASSRVSIEVSWYVATDEDNMGYNIFRLYQTEQWNGTAPIQYEGELHVRSIGGKVSLYQPTSIEAGTAVTKDLMLSRTPSPATFLLSYCKLYGLQLQVRDTELIISTRNNFYDGSIQDISSFIDRQSITTQPLVFSKKWHRLMLPQEKTYLAELYLKAHEREYGELKLDTGYPFSKEIEDLFQSSQFKGAVTMRDNGYQYFRYYDSEGKELIPAIISGYTKEESKVFVGYQSRIPLNEAYEGYDVMQRICGYSGEGVNKKSVDMANVLVFFNGMRDMQTNFYISDDFSKSENAWRICSKADSFAKPTNYLPEFSRYRGINPVVYSLDFATPKEVYDPEIVIYPDSSLYSQFWKSLLTDQYDVNSKIVKCKVRFPERKGADLLRSFYWFDNAVWVLNAMSNYSISTDDLVECEFIKVNDIKNYSQGQTIGQWQQQKMYLSLR